MALLLVSTGHLHVRLLHDCIYLLFQLLTLTFQLHRLLQLRLLCHQQKCPTSEI